MVLVREIVKALQMQQEGFVRAAYDVKATLQKIEELEVLRELRVAGALEGWDQECSVYAMRLSHVLKMLPQKADHLRLLPLLEAAKTSKPPPVHKKRQQGGADVPAVAASQCNRPPTPQDDSCGMRAAAAALESLAGLQTGSVSLQPMAAAEREWWQEEEAEDSWRIGADLYGGRPVQARLVRAKLGR